jgi:hypothetical protein
MRWASRNVIDYENQTDYKNKIDEFLDSFRTQFWIGKHQWFVQYHWHPSTGFNLMYTVPYAFKIFDSLPQGYRIKSTCPNAEDYTCNCVRIVTVKSPELLFYPIAPQLRFPKLEHCPIEIFTNHEFQKYHSALNKLTTLCIKFDCKSSNGNLNELVRKAPRLSSIKFYIGVDTEILQLRNTSIRSLDFTCGAPCCQSYFGIAKCIMLANSSLGRQCEFLSINVENRIDILYLIKNMLRLQSLAINCEPHSLVEISTTLDRWLCHTLPSTCVITNRLNSSYHAELWIPISARDFETPQSLCERLRNCYP